MIGDCAVRVTYSSVCDLTWPCFEINSLRMEGIHFPVLWIIIIITILALFSRSPPPATFSFSDKYFCCHF